MTARRSPTLLALLAPLLLGSRPVPAAAQAGVELRGYALGLATRVADGAFGPGGSQQLARVRLMPALRAGAFSVDAAWEHLLTRQSAGAGGIGLLPDAATGAGADWLDLEGTVLDRGDTRWVHRLDRLSVSWEGEAFAVTVGRQTISWATTLFLTPADPFSPFDPSDPFREYRGGVDAIRIRAFPGPFTELDLVARGAGTPDGDRTTVVARGQTSRAGWAFGGWGGWFHGRGAGALFASGALGTYAVRAEAAVRDAEEAGGPAVRSAVGLDRRLSLMERDVYVIWEVQYDGLGATGSSDLLEVIKSKPFSRGEMQVLGRWTSVLQMSAQVHPLVSVDGLAMASLGDDSVLLSPGVSWSATGSANVRVGAYFGLGDDTLVDGAPGSAYGTVPDVVYASLSWFF